MSPVTYKPARAHADHPASRPARTPGAGDLAPILVRLDDGTLASLADVDHAALPALRLPAGAEGVVGGVRPSDVICPCSRSHREGLYCAVPAESGFESVGGLGCELGKIPQREG